SAFQRWARFCIYQRRHKRDGRVHYGRKNTESRRGWQRATHKKSYQPRAAGNGKISTRHARLCGGRSFRESKRDRTGGSKIFFYPGTLGRSAENEGCGKTSRER